MDSSAQICVALLIGQNRSQKIELLKGRPISIAEVILSVALRQRTLPLSLQERFTVIHRHARLTDCGVGVAVIHMLDMRFAIDGRS